MHQGFAEFVLEGDLAELGLLLEFTPSVLRAGLVLRRALRDGVVHDAMQRAPSGDLITCAGSAPVGNELGRPGAARGADLVERRDVRAVGGRATDMVSVVAVQRRTSASMSSS